MIHLKPVEAGDIRVARPGDEGMTDTTGIVKADRTLLQGLPDDFADADLLAVQLDQSNIGADGMAFTIFLLALMDFCQIRQVPPDGPRQQIVIETLLRG